MLSLVGIIGLIMCLFALTTKNERKRNGLLSLGMVAMVIYSLSLGDMIFVVLALVMAIYFFLAYRRAGRHSLRRFSR
jgi:Ca2+/Na+ antiporter